LEQEEAIASTMAKEWKRDYEFRFMTFMAEMDTPFWHMIMKDLLDKTFGPLK